MTLSRMGPERSTKHWRTFAIIWLAVLCPSYVVAGTVASLDDIQIWIGTGPNRAALAIDWAGQDTSSQSLVWGFRWDGVATSAEMLQAIVTGDPRLHAKVGPVGNLGLAVFGIGYDASGDSEFALDDGTTFDENGLAVTGPADLATSIDPQDLYREGWFLGYWHQGVTNGSPSGWSSGPGLSSRTLVDGDWDSLAYTDSIFDQSSFASGLISAEHSTNDGDYNRDGRVDAADFTVWRDQLGTYPIAAGFGADGNRDFVVNHSDWIVWRDAFASDTGSNLPEPAGLGSMVIVGLQWIAIRRRKRRSHNRTRSEN